jgi:hypothetical protein
MSDLSTLAFTNWARAFLLTQATEVPVYRLAGCTWAHTFIPSALTHPLLTVLACTWHVEPFSFDAILAELIVTAVEGAYLLRFARIGTPFAWSLAANATSFGIGLALSP